MSLIIKSCLLGLLFLVGHAYGCEHGCNPFDHLFHHHAKMMEKYGVKSTGCAFGMKENKYNYIALTYTVQKMPSVESAREWILPALLGLQAEINSNEAFSQYVDPFPLPLEAIEVAIVNENGEEELFSVSNCGEKIIYRKNACRSLRPVVMFEESIADASARLKSLI